MPHQFECPRDPKDEKYVGLALAAGAGYLITRDRDLLDLMDDAGFRQRFPGLAILNPVSFLGLVPETDDEERDG